MSGADQATAPDQPSPPAPRIGRPPVWTPERIEVAQEDILRYLAEGKSLTFITAQPDMPSWPTIREWLRTSSSFATEYARAREAAAHMMAATVLDVAEEVRNGKLDAAAGRTVVDALKWAAAKHAPKVYGDQVDVNHSGNVTVTPGYVIDLSPAQGPVIEGDTVQDTVQIEGGPRDA